MNKKQLLLLLLVLCAFSSCRKDPEIIPETATDFTPIQAASIQGFYVLNEGIMNQNKASLDFCDYAGGFYRCNIYNSINPQSVKGLGDVGNDIQVYGSKLYAIINKSNKLEVLDVKTTKSLKVIPLDEARFVTFHNGKAYVSAYTKNLKGTITEIDTATFNVLRTVEVGRQPEEICVVENRLYVANSGGYSAPDYEKTISVIDLDSFTVVDNFEVAVNLKRLRADDYGDLYVCSLGDYDKITPALFVVDSQTGAVKNKFDITVENLCIANDIAYIVGSSYNMATGQTTVSYNRVDVRTETLLSGNFITDGTDKEIRQPTCVAVCPETKNIYVCDAIDYTVPGTLYCFDAQGKKQWTMDTGDIPAHITFVKK